MKKTNKYEMDMCSGSIVRKVLRFAIPLMLTSMLQLLFNAADVAVVGRFAGKNALAAVGSTGALINLIINVLMGLSVGTSVLVAKYYGANDADGVRKTVHTSIAVSLYGGILIGALGVAICRPMLQLMGSPEDVIDGAALYLRIYFAGFPVISVYNFGSAILRAVGDTKRPMYYLTIAGAVNLVLNLLFVIVFKMGVAGVAIPTVISQAIAAFLVVRCLLKTESCTQLVLEEIKIDREKMIEIAKIGLPAGIQGSVFSVSNVIIQSSINSFGSTVIAANSAAANLEGFPYVSMTAFYQAAIPFMGQNVGAKRYDRVLKIVFVCMGLVALFGAGIGIPFSLFSGTLLKIYATDPEVIHYGTIRMANISATYFICGWMDVMVGIMRGMGHSLTPMIVSITGVVGFRLTWLFTVFRKFRTLQVLYLSYPVSWLLTVLVHIGCFIVYYRKMPHEDLSDHSADELTT